jgi:hypothetical protein
MQALFQLPSPEPDMHVSESSGSPASLRSRNPLPRPLLSSDTHCSSAAFRIPPSSHLQRLTDLSCFALWTVFPFSPDGRHAIDDYQDSVTIGVSARRPSRIPYAMNVRDRRRDVIHHLASTPCARLSAATVPTIRPHNGRTTKTWVSDFTGVPCPVTEGFPRSRYVLDGD